MRKLIILAAGALVVAAPVAISSVANAAGKPIITSYPKPDGGTVVCFRVDGKSYCHYVKK